MIVLKKDIPIQVIETELKASLKMKAMETGKQKVKNVYNRNTHTVIYLLIIFLFGGWQSKNERKLNEEQYKLLNDFFTSEINLFHQTSTNKNWASNINQNWLNEELYFYIFEDENDKQKIIKELTKKDFRENLRFHINNQTVPSLIEKKFIENSGIKLYKKNNKGIIPKISAPFIFDNKALIYYEDSLEESIFYLKKNESGKWEWICKITLFVIFVD